MRTSIRIKVTILHQIYIIWSIIDNRIIQCGSLECDIKLHILGLQTREQEQQQKKAETAYDEELEDMQDAFSRWLASLQEMKLPSDGDRTIARELQNYETKENFLQNLEHTMQLYSNLQKLNKLLIYHNITI